MEGWRTHDGSQLTINVCSYFIQFSWKTEPVGIT